LDLAPEPQEIKGDRESHWQTPRNYGIPEEEIAFVLHGLRVELNAMPADAFVQWLVEALAAQGLRKVAPSAAVLDERARHIVAAQAIAPKIKALEALARRTAARRKLLVDLADRVAAELADDPAAPWEDVLERALEA
jgi:hypothetical protein